MNADTIVAVCCYAGDAALVQRAMPTHFAHGCPIVVLSPADSPVIASHAQCFSAGKRAYIGAESWTRQHEHLKILLSFPQKYFLIHDADSLCVSAEIPKEVYEEGTIWAGVIPESRPHTSPYPKLALHPPYFLTRDSIQRMLQASSRVPVHPITPFIDFAMLAWACEAGLKIKAHTDLEQKSEYVFRPSTDDPNIWPWQQLDYRIRYQGMTMIHPIKTPEHLELCVEARKFYESGRVS
jgi:hypothetical protein